MDQDASQATNSIHLHVAWNNANAVGGARQSKSTFGSIHKLQKRQISSRRRTLHVSSIDGHSSLEWMKKCKDSCRRKNTSNWGWCKNGVKVYASINARLLNRTMHADHMVCCLLLGEVSCNSIADQTSLLVCGHLHPRKKVSSCTLMCWNILMHSVKPFESMSNCLQPGGLAMLIFCGNHVPNFRGCMAMQLKHKQQPMLGQTNGKVWDPPCCTEFSICHIVVAPKSDAHNLPLPLGNGTRKP